MKNRSGGLVYSTEHGRMCPGCSRPLAECICTKSEPASPGDGVVRIFRERKGRGGKVVTVIKGAPLDAQGLVQLGKRLRTICGSGGTVKDGVIEIQGDHSARMLEELKGLGWVVKQAGG